MKLEDFVNQTFPGEQDAFAALDAKLTELSQVEIEIGKLEFRAAELRAEIIKGNEAIVTRTIARREVAALVRPKLEQLKQ